MATALASLDVTQYVRINNGLNPLVLQSLRDSVRIAFNDTQPALSNTAFHMLDGGDAPLCMDHLDANAWALAMTDESRLVVTEHTNGIYSHSGDFLVEVMKGNVPGHSYVHKFGSYTLTTALAALAVAGVYQTPTTAQSLEVLSNDANDTAAGSGAQELTIVGLDSNWNEVTQTVEMNGVTPVALSTNLIRLYRFHVSRSGSYADLSTPSYAGQITVRGAGAGVTWAQTNGFNIFPAQSEIASYTIPVGYTGYILAEDIYVDSNKSANVFFLQRPNADDVSSPFTGARRLVGSFVGVSDNASKDHRGPKGPFVGPCDIGYVGLTVTGTADVVAEFDILLVQDGF